MIYVHSDVGSTKNGALKIFRQMYIKADKERQDRLLQIHVVQPSKWLSLRMNFAKTCKKEAKEVFNKIFVHKKISDFINFLRDREPDTLMIIKFVK